MRQSGGIGLAALALWGVAGAITPDASLGGVSLSRYGAGGQVGGWLDSPVGWGLILIGLVGAFAMIAPTAAQAVSNAAGRALERALRWSGREVKERGPGVLGAIARGVRARRTRPARRNLGRCPLGRSRTPSGHTHHSRAVARITRRTTTFTLQIGPARRAADRSPSGGGRVAADDKC